MAAPVGVKLFFFKQKRFRQPPKRYRKLPEELPQSLRFAHLNPKVAAFLANKEKVQRQTDEADGLVKTSLLPEITQSFHHVRGRIDSLLENDEDSQRYLYEEARLSAASVLSQLAKYIYTLQEISSCIPKSLEYLLMMGWKEMTADITPVPREWQTATMRETYPPTHSSEEHAGSNEEEPTADRSRQTSDSDFVKMKSSMKLNPDSAKSNAKFNRLFHEDDDPKSSSSHRRSDKCPTHIRQKMARHSRLKSICDESRSGSAVSKSPGSQRGSVTSIAGEQTPADKGVHNTYSATIQFQLSSQACKEKGWIVRHSSKEKTFDEPEPFLELAVQILQSAMRRAKQEAENVDPKLEHPHKVKYYKDTNQGHLTKFNRFRSLSQGQSLKPVIPEAWNDAGRKLMQVTVNDGTTTIFYPSGHPAILSSQAGPGKPGYYTLVYGDVPGGKLMACFTPSGIGVCMHNNGNVRLQITKKGGLTADPSGKILKKWKWPVSGMKLPSTISLQMSSCLNLRVQSQSQIFLLFVCNKETIKFMLGPVPGAVPLKPGDEEELLTSFSFSSNSANELNQSFTSKKQLNKSKKKKDKMKAYIAEAQKLLDDRDESDPDGERDLGRLQRKARLLVDNWMEHYRIYVGLSTGSLKYMKDMIYIRLRDIQSAKPSKTKVVPEESETTEVDIESPDPLAKLRAPSAPAGSEVTDRLLNRARTASSHRLSADDKDIDETDSKIKKETTHGSAKRSPVHSAGKQRPLSGGLQSIVSHTAPLSPRGGAVASMYSGPAQCPISLRAEMLGYERPPCRCSRHHIPYISDLEFDNFLKNEASMNQMIIVAIVSTLYPDATPAEAMIEKIHANQNKNRTRPCAAARFDAFRILRYDVATAAFESDHTQPMLLARHNVVPGMFLIYHNGNLVFCDHIFNGYGNAKKDFRKQIMKCRADAIHHRFLPKDFHFSPSHGRVGPRSAWGGQMGGAGVDHHGNPGMSRDLPSSAPRPVSASTSSTEHYLQSVPSAITRGVEVTENKQPVSIGTNPSQAGDLRTHSQLESQSASMAHSAERINT
ncbi:LOW QUALITY PROTEIN: uncharacterized protein C3orf20 homolog [Liolophura sinensis]|uniref:LOW QUALITY PROTEIN: uncharacterized protein C3orf20 homolog n=1 Tax=Liolophura sinensis TaxID=3198878 RepID=UPI0031597169